MIENRASLDVRPELNPTFREASSPGYDVFIDLSETGMDAHSLEVHLEAVTQDAGLSGGAGRVTALVPGDLTSSTRVVNLTTISAAAFKASDALHRAIRRAAQSGRHLVVVLNSLLPANEVISRLIQELARDPFFGTIQPRFADASNDHVWPLPGRRDGKDRSAILTHSGLSLLPDILITPELLAACIVVRREVVREMDRGDCQLTVVGELRRLLTQARRRGYRNVVVNRAVLASTLPYASLYPSPSRTDKEYLRTLFPEIVKADTWCAGLSQLKLESVLAGAFADESRAAPGLLLDARGMTCAYNGTSQSILGLLDGFQGLGCRWQINVLASSAVIDFFKLRKRYPTFSVIADRPQGTYAAAVLLHQPWAISTVAELHRHALLVGFHMLDTISWDILYVNICDERLDAVWRFIARYSDALFYDSQFTRDRFATRFPLQANVAERVTYLSLARDEQVDRDILGRPAGDHILLFGNEYDHKDVRRTLQLLVDAFPYAKIVVIGIAGNTPRNVVTMPSGAIEDSVLHEVIAGASIIVFPSFYEGFGMPAVQGLAYGRTVVVRQSPLWKEIAAQLQMPGQLVEFEDTASLVEAVGRALAGHPLDSLPQGSALGAGQAPLRWQDCAQRMIETLEKLLPSADGRRWLEREEVLRTVDLWRSEGPGMET